MPVFVEDPALFSKERLKSELMAHNVDLPPPVSKKHAYVELYFKHVRTNTTDFSSDEEEDHLSGSAEKEEKAEMVDLGLLTDDQLKAKLLQYGVKAGPIVACTRALHEKKLKRLMDSLTQASQHRVNGTRDAGLYSDNEEEDGREEDEDKDSSESEQLRSDMMARTENSKTASRGKIQHKSSDATQNESLSQSGSPYRSFSITQMVEEIETRFSLQSKQTEIERRSVSRSKQTVDSRVLRDFMRRDKDTMTGRSLCLTSPSSHQKLTVTVTAFPPSAFLFSPQGLPLCLSSLFRWMFNSADMLHCQKSNGLSHSLCPLGNTSELSLVSSFSPFIALAFQMKELYSL